MAGAQAAGATDAQYRYRYVSLDHAVLPDGFASFNPVEVVDNGKVYGTVYRSDDPDGCFPSVAVWQNGSVTVLVEGGTAGAANNSGTVAGSVVRDCAGELALFRSSGLKLIPTPPDALFNFINQLTDPGVTLIESFFIRDDLVQITPSLFRRGELIPLDVGPGLAVFSRVNGSGGIVAGTYIQPGSGSGSDDTRAFRYQTSSGTTTFLQPLPTERISWGLGIHENGDVLGYSWNPGSIVGVWRNVPGRPFQTYLVEGTPEFPDISFRLLWNEPGLIVVTITLDYNSYIVPRPGVALNLAELTNVPLPERGLDITDINNKGDLLGIAFDPDTFESENLLLLRVGDGQTAPPTIAAAQRHPPMPRGLMRALHPELFEPREKGKAASPSAKQIGG